MVGTLVTFSIIGLVLMISVLEILRFRTRHRQIDGLGYTRKRFIRRIGVNFLLVAVVLMIHFKPEDLEAMTDLVWMTACLAAGVLIMILVFRDLRETSAAVVREHQKFIAEAEKDMLTTIPEMKAAKARRNRKAKG